MEFLIILLIFIILYKNNKKPLSKDEREERLIRIAEESKDEYLAYLAMSKLQRDYDPTYMWCHECGGKVLKESECCLTYD